MIESNFYYSKNNGIYYIKLIGSITYTKSAGFDKFLELIFNDDDLNDIVLDLTETNYMDSTNLGLICKIANFIYKKFNRKVVMISTNDNLNELLRSVGFHMVFNFVDSYENIDIEMQKIENLETNKNEIAKMILEAHKTLLESNDENYLKFKNVVDLLQKNYDDHYKG